MRLLFLLFTLLPSLCFAAIVKTDIRFSASAEEIIFISDTPIKLQKSFTLASPARLVIDVSKQAHGKGAGLSPAYRGTLINNIRFGQFNERTSRLVIDLATSALAYQAHEEGRSIKILLASNAKAATTTAHSATKPARRPPITASPFPLPTPKPQHLAVDAKKPVIVIDAGHGGKDSGAVGKSGLLEKHVVFKYAQELRKALLRTGRYRVALTRNDDRYLFLKERVAAARKQQGDAFLSIHADSNPRSDAQGLSVYTLSEKASDSEAAALAQQENKADIIGGLDLSIEDETVANILIDLAQRETNNKSSRLAEYIISATDKRIPLITNPHRHAGFRVLKAPDIPSVLVEVGFLSNREDERRVNSSAYRARVIHSLIKALDRFFYAGKPS